MASIARISVDLVANSAKFRRDLNQAARSSDNFFKKLSKQSQGMVKSFAALGVTIAGAFAATSLRVYGDYEAALADVRAKTDSTRAGVAQLSAVLQQAARDTKFTATQTGQAATFLAQAGLSVREIEQAIRPTLDIASATGSDVQMTADIVTNIMSGLQIQASDIGAAGDVLASATANSNTNLEQLGEAFKYATSGAIGFNMDIVETTALLGTFANLGLKGSIAGNAISQAWVSLARGGNVTERALADVTGGATRQEKALRRLGVATVKQDGNLRSLTDILIDLEKSGASATDIVEIFGARAAKALVPVLEGGTGQILQLRETLDGARGAAERMAAVQMDSLNGDLTRLGSQVQHLQLLFTQGGFGAAIRRGVQRLTKVLRDMEPVIQKLAPYVDDFVLALSAVAGAALAAGIASLIPVFVSLGVAILTTPIGWIAAGVAGLVFVFTRWRGETQATLEVIWSLIKAGFEPLWNLQVAFYNWLKNAFVFVWETLVDTWKTARSTAETLGTTIKDKLILPIRNSLKIVSDWVDKYMPEGLKELLGWAKTSGLASPFAAMAEGIKVGGIKVVSTLTEVADAAFDKVYDAGQNAYDAWRKRADEINAEQERLSAAGGSTADFGSDGSGAFDPINVTGSKMEEAERYQESILGIYESINDKAKENANLLKLVEEKKWGDLVAAASKGSKLMSGIQKAFALKTAIWDGYAAINKAWASAPFPANLAAVALTSAATFANVQSILGQAHDGIDNIPATGTYLLQSGERVVDRRLNKDLSSYLAQKGDDNSTTNNRTINANLAFNANAPDPDSFDQYFRANRARFETMIREVFAEHAQDSPLKG